MPDICPLSLNGDHVTDVGSNFNLTIVVNSQIIRISSRGVDVSDDIPRSFIAVAVNGPSDVTGSSRVSPFW